MIERRLGERLLEGRDLDLERCFTLNRRRKLPLEPRNLQSRWTMLRQMTFTLMLERVQ